MLGSIVLGLCLGLGSALWQTQSVAARSEIKPGAAIEEPGMPALPPADGPQPKVEINQLHYNFGFMERSATGTHAFRITNGGDSPLRLRKGPTSCKCTLSSLEEQDIPPGGTADVTLEWRAKGEEPHFRQTATIFTNDRNHRRLELTVDGVLVQSLNLNPPQIVFTGVTRNEQVVGRSRLTSSIVKDLKVVNVTYVNAETADLYDVQWEPIPAAELGPGDQGGCEITVTVKPGLPFGEIRQTIKLETNVASAPPAELRVGGKVGSPIMIVGPVEWNSERHVLRLGFVSKATGAKRELKLMIRGPRRAELKFGEPKTDPEELHASLGEPKDLGNVIMVPLAIEIPPGLPTMVRQGTPQGAVAKITIDTNDPEVGQLEVPVSFTITD